MTPKPALGFVKTNGIVLESGRGLVFQPSSDDRRRGGPRQLVGASKGARHLSLSRAIRESNDVLVCRLVANKVTMCIGASRQHWCGSPGSSMCNA